MAPNVCTDVQQLKLVCPDKGHDKCTLTKLIARLIVFVQTPESTFSCIGLSPREKMRRRGAPILTG